MKRRAFLEVTAAGVGALAGWPRVGPVMAASGGETSAVNGVLPPDGYQAPDWVRFMRAVYFDGYSAPVYPHIKDFDAKRLVETVTVLGGDTLRFQPLGYRACYPSKAFPVHPDLANRDLIDEVSRECRKAGVHVYCYAPLGVNILDLKLIQDQPRFAPWLRLDPKGEPAGRGSEYGHADTYYVDITGDAYRQDMQNVVHELCGYDIDGVYFDSPSCYRGVCFCPTCRKNFKQFSGMDLDRLRNVPDLNGGPGGDTLRFQPVNYRKKAGMPSDADMIALMAWYDWSNTLVREDLADFRKTIHGQGKFMLCHNFTSWQAGSLPLQYRIPEGFMEEYSVQIYERLFRGMIGSSMARPYKKLSQLYMGSQILTWGGTPPHSKDVVHITDLEDTDELRMEGFANLAGGSMPIYAVANRLYYGIGSGSAKPAHEVFAFMQRNESHLKDSVPAPYVSLVPTWDSLQLWRTRSKSWNIMMTQGFFLAMLDERIGCDVYTSTEMSDEWLKEQRAIALCGASVVKDEDARRLADWVRAGGGLLATYDTGLYDEKGAQRRDGGALREVLGVEMMGAPLEGVIDSYYRVKTTHPALGEYGQGAIVLGDSPLMPVKLREGATLLADCWALDTDNARGPAIVANQYGQGRTIYVAGSLEAQYAAGRVPSVQRMLGSMVRYVGGNQTHPFKLAAPKGVYGIPRRAANGDPTLWIIANVGFKDEVTGRLRQEYMPVSNVEVQIRVPAGRQVKSVELLRSGQDVNFTVEGDYTVATLPVVHIAELVHVALV